MQEIEQRMQKAVESVESELKTIRTGRANPGILDRVHVDYYGTKTPLKNLANIAVPEPKTLTVTPFDMNSLIDVEKAISDADLGFTPNNDGSKIIIVIPDLTQDRRKELVKMTKELVENGKVAIRNIRRDEMNRIKKDESLTEDDKKGDSNKIEDITKKYIEKVENLAASKEKELLTI